jgi:hypothetical protein
VLQDLLALLDTTFQAFFRRLMCGEKAGFPGCQGRDHHHSFTYRELGNGATLDNGFFVLSKTGSIAVRWSRPLVGTIKTVMISREADGWYVCFSCADVPIQPLPETSQETGKIEPTRVAIVCLGARIAAQDLATLNETARALLERHYVGVLFQNAHLFPVLTAQKNVETPLRPGHVTAAHERGERARRALVTAPRLLVADEPTGNLDAQTGRAIAALLREVAHGEGIGMLIATHDATIAATADRVLHLRDGALSDVEQARWKPSRLWFAKSLTEGCSLRHQAYARSETLASRAGHPLVRMARVLPHAHSRRAADQRRLRPR